MQLAFYTSSCAGELVLYWSLQELPRWQEAFRHDFRDGARLGNPGFFFSRFSELWFVPIFSSCSSLPSSRLHSCFFIYWYFSTLGCAWVFLTLSTCLVTSWFFVCWSSVVQKKSISLLVGVTVRRFLVMISSRGRPWILHILKPARGLRRVPSLLLTFPVRRCRWFEMYRLPALRAANLIASCSAVRRVQEPMLNCLSLISRCLMIWSCCSCKAMKFL